MKWSEFKVIVDDALAGSDPDIDYINIRYSNVDIEMQEVVIYNYCGDICIYN